MNYDTLTDQIKHYAARYDEYFTSQVPNFIEQGINRIYSEAKNIGFEIIITGDIATNATTLNKPANWRETVSLEIFKSDQSFSKFLLPRSYEFCKTYWPNQTLTEVPEFYADYNNYNNFFISPTANEPYQYRLIYLGVPLFNAANGDNFLTQRYPRLLFYACMLEAIPFLQNDSRLPQFEQLYASCLSDINQDTTDNYIDRTTKREAE